MRTCAYATQIVLEEMKKIREADVTDEELQTAKSSFVDTLSRRFTTKAQTMGVFVDEEFTGRFATGARVLHAATRHGIEKVTKADVKRVARAPPRDRQGHGPRRRQEGRSPEPRPEAPGEVPGADRREGDGPPAPRPLHDAADGAPPRSSPASTVAGARPLPAPPGFGGRFLFGYRPARCAPPCRSRSSPPPSLLAPVLAVSGGDAAPKKAAHPRARLRRRAPRRARADRPPLAGRDALHLPQEGGCRARREGRPLGGATP